MIRQDEFKIDFTYTDLFEYAGKLAEQMNVPFDGNEIIYPENIASGYSKFFKINDYISYQVAHYTARQKMVFDRLPSSESNIVIAFRNFSFIKNGSSFFFCPDIELNKNSLGSIHCKNTQLPEKLVIESGFELKVILVLLKEDWLQHILHDSANKDKFTRYLVNQNENLLLRKEFLSPMQNKLFTKIFEGNNCFLMQNLFYDSRVLNLLESFLKEVLVKEDAESPYLFASYEDILMLQKAEKYINENLMNPFPGVDVLSRISCMCRTKFINLFQKVYGLSSFEYSQKKRLAIAYEYLKSGKYSVCDTAQIIGYAGANNFAVAFKKEFGMLPSELLERIKDMEHAV
jgi:AraC-like DNA-binding protein